MRWADAGDRRFSSLPFPSSAVAGICYYVVMIGWLGNVGDCWLCAVFTCLLVEYHTPVSIVPNDMVHGPAQCISFSCHSCSLIYIALFSLLSYSREKGKRRGEDINPEASVVGSRTHHITAQHKENICHNM